jgi:hypothetical protein
MNVDGSGVTKLIDEDYVYCFNVVGDRIFYTAADTALYSIGLDGSGKTLISRETGLVFNAIGDRVFYTNSDAFYSLNLDGGDVRKLGDGVAFAVNYVAGRVYFRHQEGSDYTTVSVNSDGSDRRVETGMPRTESPHAATPAVSPVPTEYYNPILGMFKGGNSHQIRTAEEFEADRVFVDLGTAGAPFVLELGYLWLGDRSGKASTDESDWFAHILSINGEPIEPISVEPVVKNENPYYIFYSGVIVSGGDLDGDGQTDLLLHFPKTGSGGTGGGYYSAFAVKDGNITRLPVPDYLHSSLQDDLTIEIIGDLELRISCKDPVFGLDVSINECYVEGHPYERTDFWVIPAYAYRIADGYVELRQYVYFQAGDLVTKLRWDAGGKPIVDVRFEAY